jgi:hypothetical protein
MLINWYYHWCEGKDKWGIRPDLPSIVVKLDGFQIWCSSNLLTIPLPC